MKLNLLIITIVMAFLLMPSTPVFAQSADTVKSKDATIIGIDTTTFFTMFESLVKNAIQTYHAGVIDKDADVDYRSMYVLVRTRGLISQEFLPVVGGLETDWVHGGGVFCGLELLDKKSDKYLNVIFNVLVAGFIEGTTAKDKDGWNAGGVIAGQVSLNTLSGK